MTIDIDKVISSVNALDVAEYLGMEINHKGKYNFILCPGHEKITGHADTKANNCVLTDHGYHCFTCNKSENVITMVSQYTGMSFSQALNLVAEIAGGEDLFAVKNSKDMYTMRLPLSNEELLVIGLKPTTPVSFVNKASDIEYGDLKYAYRLHGKDVLVSDKTAKEITLLQLFKTKEALFNKYIYIKAKDAVNKYDALIEKYCSREGEGMTAVYTLLNSDGAIPNEAFTGLKNAFLKRRTIALKIYNTYKEKVFG